MSAFTSPQVILFTADIQRATAFYESLGFREVFRVPATGTPLHADLELDGYRIGLATETTSREEHGLNPATTGQRATIVLWTDDTPTSYQRLLELGATALHSPRPFLGRLLIAWALDPDGHAIQVVQEA